RLDSGALSHGGLPDQVALVVEDLASEEVGVDGLLQVVVGVVLVGANCLSAGATQVLLLLKDVAHVVVAVLPRDPTGLARAARACRIGIVLPLDLRHPALSVVVPAMLLLLATERGRLPRLHTPLRIVRGGPDHPRRTGDGG